MCHKIYKKYYWNGRGKNAGVGGSSWQICTRSRCSCLPEMKGIIQAGNFLPPRHIIIITIIIPEEKIYSARMSSWAAASDHFSLSDAPQAHQQQEEKCTVDGNNLYCSSLHCIMGEQLTTPLSRGE